MTTKSNTRSRQAMIIAASMVVVFVLMRIVLHLAPNSNFDVAGYNIHHLFTGVLLLIIAAVPLVLGMTKGKVGTALNIVFGAGLALVLDEWVYLIATDGSDASYLLPVSLYSGMILIALATAYIVFLGRR